VGEREAARQKHLSEIAQAELGAQAPHDDEENDVGRERKVGEGRARTLIELSLAGRTAKCSIAKLGTLDQFACGRGGAVWTGHSVLPGELDSEPPRIPEKLEELEELSLQVRSDGTAAGPAE
jgi:hypothetical protein